MKISCPHCGQHFDVEEADFGKEADCTNCGKRFVLQAPASPVSPEQPSSSSEKGETQDSAVSDETFPETDSSLQVNHAEIDEIVGRYLRPGDDETMRRALEVVIMDGKASTAHIQRRLKLGYNRTAEIMDVMEERGIVGPPSGSGSKRKILVPHIEAELPPKTEPSSHSVGRCPYCGGEISPGVKKCRHCGEWLNPKNCPRSPVVYVLLGLFGGLFGLHSFYANRSGFGALHCVLTFWGLVALFFGGILHKDGAVIGGLLLLINCVLIMIGLVKCESCR